MNHNSFRRRGTVGIGRFKIHQSIFFDVFLREKAHRRR